jgi:hypothetical protein
MGLALNVIGRMASHWCKGKLVDLSGWIPEQTERPRNIFEL